MTVKQHEVTARKGLRPWFFFALTFALTWIFWVPIAFSGRNVMEGPLMIPLLLGGFGPSVAGIILIYRTQDREGRVDFWRRSFDFKQIGRRWYAVILLIFPVAYGLASLLDVLMGGTAPGAEAVAQIVAQPASLLVMLLMALVMGPLAEEFGWRGFALDALQAKWSALASSLVLGLFWWSWHFPLFSMVGMVQSEWGIGTLAFWTFAAMVFAQSVLYAWVYNNTGRSILAAILLHFMHNSTQNLLAPISDRTFLFSTMLLVLGAILVVLRWGPKTFTRQRG
jgi:membrane protease YdiL (CAAX protease family)